MNYLERVRKSALKKYVRLDPSFGAFGMLDRCRYILAIREKGLGDFGIVVFFYQ